MKIFVTGATGLVGSAVVEELLRGGHHVTGLARSSASADKLKKAGASVLSGAIEDFETLRAGALAADAVIHLAFNHDFSKFAESGALEKKVIGIFGDALKGSDRTFIATSGVAMAAPPGQISTEAHIRGGDHPFPRDAETPTLALAKQGIRSMVVRLSVTTYGDGAGGFAGIFSQIARAKGKAGYLGEGKNLWPAVHRLDAAKLYRLALEKGEPGAIYHAVAEQGIPTRDIALAIGEGLGIPAESISPENAENYFGGFKNFAALDTPASAEITKAKLGWRPTEIGLLEDLRRNLKR